MLPDHAFEYTAFRDVRTIVDRRFSYPLTATNFVLSRPAALGANLGNNYSDRGGRAKIGRMPYVSETILPFRHYSGRARRTLRIAVRRRASPIF